MCPPPLLGQGFHPLLPLLPACSLPPVGATFGVPTTSVGQACSQPALLAPLTPSLLPLLPSLPACSLLLPAHSQLAPLGQGRLGVCYTMLWIPTTSVGARVSGVRGSELGAGGSEVILGFRVPTTSGGKTSMITYSAYVSPPPGSTIPTQCPFT